MGEIHVYLENGFDHDRVTVSVGEELHTADDVSTRYQVGLAAVVDLTVANATPSLVRVAVPGRDLTGEAEVDPAATPHLRVSIADGALDVQPQAAPPMFA